MLRLVVCCRRAVGEAPSKDRPDDSLRQVERARQLASKAEALGAELLGWGATATSFGFEAEAIEDAIALALDAVAAGETDRGVGCVGMADGELTVVDGNPRLAYGPPLVAAEALAAIARPGEIVVARDLGALVARVLTPMGARAGFVARRRVRGVAVDPREPWRKSSEAAVAKLVSPAFFGRDRLAPLLACRGKIAVIAADPGLGGSRALAEIAIMNAPGPSLLVAPVGARMEPLGALRVAFKRFMAQHPERVGAELLPLLDPLLAGTGIGMQAACALVLTALRAENGGIPGALLLDDVHEIDEETLEACARVQRAGDAVHVIARADATGELPAPLAGPRGNVVTLAPFGRRDGEAFAIACLGGAVAEQAAARWARRGGYTPLGTIEALAAGLTDGDLAWTGNEAVPRRRFAGKGRVRDATEWVRERASFLEDRALGLATAVAMLGGSAPTELVREVLAAAGRPVELGPTSRALVAARWLAPAEDRRLTLASSTHARALLSRLDEEAAVRWHAACADAIARDQGLALADAADHAVDALQGERASELARRAGDVAAAAELDGAATRLYAFARAARGEAPDSEVPISIGGDAAFDDNAPTHQLRLSTAMREAAMAHDPLTDTQVDTSELATSPGVRLFPLVPRPDLRRHERRRVGTNEPTVTAMRADAGPPARKGPPPLPARARPARPADPNGAAHDPASSTIAIPVAPDPATVQAARRPTAALQKLPEILRLRAAKSEAATVAARCRTALALGVALASVARIEEALLEGLEALARAREEENERGLEACLAFLAKLFARASRPEESRRIRLAARRPEDERLRPPY